METPIQDTSTPVAPVSTDWRPYLSEDLKADPVVSGWAAKASEKDIPALIKGYAHSFTKQGNAINLPGKDAKPEDVAALKTKLYESGVLSAPPKTAADYKLKFAGDVPAGLAWSDELSAKFGEVLHKHGIPQSAVDELLPLYYEGLTGAGASLKTDLETAMDSMKREHGDQYDTRLEMVRRMFGGIFKDQGELDFFEQTGIGNHPAFLSVMMRLAPLAMQDSSFMESVQRKGGELDREKWMEEYHDIASNPKNPHYDGFHRGDPKTMAYIKEAYDKIYGTQQRPPAIESFSLG